MARSEQPSSHNARLLRRAKPYIRSYLQALQNDQLVRRATLQGPFLVVLARRHDLLPNPVVLDTPSGRVELRTRCVTSRPDYDILRRWLRAPKHRRHVLARRYPELLDLAIPKDAAAFEQDLDDPEAS